MGANGNLSSNRVGFKDFADRRCSFLERDCNRCTERNALLNHGKGVAREELNLLRYVELYDVIQSLEREIQRRKLVPRVTCRAKERDAGFWEVDLVCYRHRKDRVEAAGERLQALQRAITKKLRDKHEGGDRLRVAVVGVHTSDNSVSARLVNSLVPALLRHAGDLHERCLLLASAGLVLAAVVHVAGRGASHGVREEQRHGDASTCHVTGCKDETE
mmetsp:Transcript_71095/g.179979  ORF Transcript_71095/g.179979 Transcript_71095/m.179979 type:complete len:217 (+) Transcript_71095:511-1161(+)